GEKEAVLKRGLDGWKLEQPFAAPAQNQLADRLAAALTAPQVVRYESLDGRDLKKYGLDKPALTLTLTDRTGKEHTLLIGAPAGMSGERYARAADRASVFVADRSLSAVEDYRPLALLAPVRGHLV